VSSFYFLLFIPEPKYIRHWWASPAGEKKMPVRACKVKDKWRY